MRLREALEQTATAMLRRIATHHGLSHGVDATRPELIERVGQRLLDAAYLDEQVASLDAGQRRVLLAARASAGELRGYLIDRTEPGAVEALAERGLLYRVFATAGPLRGEVFTAPDEVLQLLPGPPPAPPLPAGEPPPADRRTSDPVFSVFALASAFTRRGGHLEREVRGWSQEPGGWDWDARWTFLRHLAQASGLLIRQADGTLTTSSRLPRLLDRPSELTQLLWRSYLADRGWSELARAGVEHGEGLADAVPLRQALVDTVQQLPDNAWIGLEAFVEWVRQTRPTLVREQLNARGLVELESLDWVGLEARLLRYCLLGPLYWLGGVGASADGRQIVRRTTSASAPRAEACTWQEDPADPAELAVGQDDQPMAAHPVVLDAPPAGLSFDTSPGSTLTVGSAQVSPNPSQRASVASPASAATAAPVGSPSSESSVSPSSSQVSPTTPDQMGTASAAQVSSTSSALAEAASSASVASAAQVSPTPLDTSSAANSVHVSPTSSAPRSVTSAAQVKPASPASVGAASAAQISLASSESNRAVSSGQASLAPSASDSAAKIVQPNASSSESIGIASATQLSLASSDSTITRSVAQVGLASSEASSAASSQQIELPSPAVDSTASSAHVSPASSVASSTASTQQVGQPAPDPNSTASSAATSTASAQQARQPSPGSSSTRGAAQVLLAPARSHLGSLLEAERYLVLLERGRLSRYQLVQAHVAGALSSGGSIRECRRLLIRLTESELPDAVARRFAAWERRFGALSVRPAVLIEARSPRELDEAIDDEQVQPFVRARLGPTVAEVPAADALELAARLRERGHLPRVDAALRLTAEPRRAYTGLVDEQVLEFLLVSLLAFQRARPECLAELEGSLTLLDRLERLFPRERLSELRAAADRLAGELAAAVSAVRRPRRRPKRARRQL